MQNDSDFAAGQSSPRDADRIPPAAADDGRVILSGELFAGARVVKIQHADELYRLMITRNNRLILQK